MPPLPLLPAAGFLALPERATACLPPLGAFLEAAGCAFLAEEVLAEALLEDAGFLAEGDFLDCCALQAADLALVLQGSVFLAAIAASGWSAQTASASGARAFAIARVQENAMV
ncbi:hypothetical protein [Achromobacter sp. DMS1]|uniref:hypothetical protein n=1 Tax=Achromobacter sp. DMS1 TaxID=1688405 RepID=UPI001364D6EA|nr:hypothetical protein [Achromobacter sp. DMS1]